MYKVVVGSSLAPIASAATYAFGAWQVKAVLSESGSATALSITMPTTASTSVEPIAEQPKNNDL